VTTKSVLLGTCSFGLLLTCFPALAQESTPETAVTRTLGVVTVTATKREESLQDVPISVSVVSGDDLSANAISTLEDATALIPNVTVAEGGVADSIFVRGIGSGVNLGFEQSVGTFIDGVYYGRSRSSRNPFFDLERVEVLKGPQSTLFGKNTIAGAFNITSKRPTDTLEGRILAGYEPEYDGKAIEAIVSGPLADGVSVRVGGRYYETDGYIENTFTGANDPTREDYILRGQLLLEPTDNLEILLKAETSQYNSDGEGYEVTRASPLLQSMVAAVDPNAEYGFNYQRSAPGTGPLFGPEGEETTADNFALTINWDIGEFTLTSITSQVGYEYDAFRDTDYTSLSFLAQIENQEYSAFGQEIRLTSPNSEMFEYIVGAYYSSEDQRNDKFVDADFNGVPPIAGALTGGFGVPVAALTGRRNQRFQQDTTSGAFFGQGTFYVNDQLRLTGGLRYTEDEKDSRKELFYSSIGLNDVNPLVSAVYPNLGFGVVQPATDRTRSEDAVTGEAIIEYDVNDAIMVFARYSRGFKAGGFDEDNVQALAESVEFDSETVDSFEAGLKTEFAGGAGRFNANAFFNTFENLQVSTYDGIASFIVGNAASAETIGIEADLAYQISNAWDFAASIGILDATYKDFPNGPAVFGQGLVQDLSGRPLQFAPEFTLNARTGYETAVFDGWTGRGEVSVYHNSGYEVPGDLDPFLAQDGFTKLDARLSLFSDDGNWDFALIGKNLTDEKTTQWGNDLPLSNLLGNNYYQRIDPPRTVTLQAVRTF
jgi:iron complex outermembrane recepter protein